MTDHPKESAVEALNEALRLMPAPVAVIGAASGDVLGGLTASWVTRVSIDPPLLLVSVGRGRYTWDLLDGSEHFTVSLPVAGDLRAARLFGLKSRRDLDKWAETPHVLLGDGIPALKDCSVRYLCARTGRFATGDHDCFVGEVIAAEVVKGAPALPMDGADYAPDKEV